MPDEIIKPGATNPDAREGVDPSIDPNQIDDTGNPKPKSPTAKEPAKEEQKEEQKTEETTEETQEPDDDTPLDTATWGDTGTETGNAVLQLLQNSGVSTADAKELLFDAITEGDVTKIDKANLEAKVGKVKATLILTGVTSFIDSKKAEAQAIVSIAHNEVGGEDNWKRVTEWANKNVAKEDLEDLRSMIDAGGRQAKLAARELKSLYEADENNSSLDTKETQERLPKNGAPKQEQSPLSGPQYAAELEKVNKKFFGNPPEDIRRALLTRRQQGRNLGL